MINRSIVWSLGLTGLLSAIGVGASTDTLKSSTSTATGVVFTSTSSAVVGSTDTSKISALLVQIKSPSERTRALALKDLGQLGPRAKANAPVIAAGVPDRLTGLLAAKALEQVDPNYAVPPATLVLLVHRANVLPEKNGSHISITRCEAQSYALDVLAALGPAARSTLPDLVRLSHRFCIHDHVMAALDRVGSPSEEQIKQIESGVSDRDPEAREAAVAYLAKSDPNADTIRTLGRAMNDSDSGVRLSALQALEDIHPEGEGRLPLLAVFAQDPSPDIRARALYMVGQLGPDAHRAEPLLRDRLKDPDPTIALTSAKYLARLNPQDEKLISALIGFMKDRGSAEGMQAARLLQSLDVHDARVDEALDPFRTQQALWDRFSKSSSIPPEQLTDNGRTMKIENLKMASSIAQDQPVNVSRHFPSNVGRVYCWTEVSVSSAPTAVIHRWFRNGHLHHEEYLEVNQTTARLWSSASGRGGDWKVDVIPVGAHDPIATVTFTVAKKNS